MITDFIYWRSLAGQLLVYLRFLFILNLASDFFLTLLYGGSHSALVLTGYGAEFHPFAIIILMVLIVGFSIAFTGTLSKGKLDHNIFSKLAQCMLVLSIAFYSVMLVLSFMTSIVLWPVVMVYIMNITWAAGLIYFRRQFQKGWGCLE